MNDFYSKPNLENKYFDDFIKTVPSLNGKTIGITGTTSGTGYVAANVIAKNNGKLILLNRKSDRAIKSFQQLKKNNPKAKIFSVECDLQSFDSVKIATKEVRSLCDDGLDVLCNNAGVMALKDAPTVDYKNIKLLKKYMSENGKILPSRITNVSQKKQRELSLSIKRARNLALI